MMRPLYTRARRWSIAALVAMASAGVGCALLLGPDKRALGQLKNRTAMPQLADFDPAVTLDAMLAPGDDRARWSDRRAARIEGLVVAVERAGIESANNFSLTRRDTHIEIAAQPDAPPRRRIIVEVTPPIRDRALAQGHDWSHGALREQLLGRRVRIAGWLLFDAEHDDEAENTNPGGARNWRATAWELHPVTAIELLEPLVPPGARTAVPAIRAPGQSETR